MDSEERHELKENDLLSSLQELGQFWKKHGRPILYVVLVLVVLVAAWRWQSTKATRRHESGWANLAAATTPEASLITGDEAHTAGLRHLAWLQSADLWLARAALPYDPDDPDSTTDTPQQMLEKAAMIYDQVINDDLAQLPFRISAMLGKASIAESQEKLDAAGAIYDQIMQQAKDVYPAHFAMAKSRRQTLKRLAKPVKFKSSPTPPQNLPGPGTDSGDAAPSDGDVADE